MNKMRDVMTKRRENELTAAQNERNNEEERGRGVTSERQRVKEEVEEKAIRNKEASENDGRKNKEKKQMATKKD